ncbi:MAG: tRNA pseudouridine(55) synthase TruB [Isosphaeraceae bacterium]
MSRKKRKPEAALADLSGWLLIDKPSGMTSRDVINQVEWKWRGVKFGHAGTLDPLASGLLLVAIGPATRLVEYSHRLSKSYEATIRLGATSSTDDADGDVTVNEIARPVSPEAISEALLQLTGPEVMQRPPAFSAIHTGGKRAYELAREGREVALSARAVRIDRIAVTAYEWPLLNVVVDCGAGTYIRSIARDLGERLGVGGMIETLRRTAIGPFTAAESIPLDKLLDELDLRKITAKAGRVLPGWPMVIINEFERNEICHGRAIPASNDFAEVIAETEVAMIDPEGNLAGLARLTERETGRWIQPFRVFVKLPVVK